MIDLICGIENCKFNIIEAGRNGTGIVINLIEKNGYVAVFEFGFVYLKHTDSKSTDLIHKKRRI